ncbi:hypothetical protein H632_c2930p0 [Helicosporidium sp. ATCC 50920]|nr:hypothetical protein H632_c2930p0 [Helicosporidium sp. ATCC 50920]|eukprot:KDD72762.1 hypothetical protein H632_c2930p0 [Helicosporidium sp. ATCC 50920]
MKRVQLLRKSWSEVSTAYEHEFVSKFMPWTETALHHFGLRPLPPGTIVVPACGPGQEIPLLAARFPSHKIVGIDLAEGMIERAQKVVDSHNLGSRVKLIASDASTIPASVTGPVAGVFCCFALNQMPRPADVLASWAGALVPGGSAVVVFWPPVVEMQGPWQVLTDLTLGSASQADWQTDIPERALCQGTVLQADCLVQHAMHWASAKEFYDVMTRAGAWHARRMQYGDAHMAEVEAKFLTALSHSGSPLVHHPSARLIALSKPQIPL